MIDCSECDNIVEIDETPNQDGTRSMVRCKSCGYEIYLNSNA